MALDELENDILIKNSLPHDIWFHVDEMPSAHVYLRMKEPITSYSEVPQTILDECAQLTKRNSFLGRKKKVVTILYTWASNISKLGRMNVDHSVSQKDKSLFLKI